MRLLALFLLCTLPVHAGPLDWVKHHKRILFIEGAAVTAALVDAKGLHHCRQGGVERCSEHYGEAWGFYGFFTGMNVIALPAIAEGCWKNGQGKFCNVFAYGGSTAQLAFGVDQWTKGKNTREKSSSSNLFALRR